jgi:alpha-L-rhamnosidase
MSAASFRFLAFAALLLAPVLVGMMDSPSLESLRKNFATPPDDARIMMRWWWFGSAVSHAELRRELETMKASGIGGVEIQPVYPLALDDQSQGIQNLPYLSPDFLDAVSFVSSAAPELGMRVDVTLGSGWPYGGPHTVISQAAGKLRYEHVPVGEGARSVMLPSISQGERLVAVFLGGKQTSTIKNGRVEIPPGLSGNDILEFFISSRTGQQVKRAAVGAEGFVLDHYDKDAIEAHLDAVATRLLGAFGGKPPHSVFSDSLEVYDSDWTPGFLAEFEKRRGYDLTPYLPALVRDIGPQTAAVRHDWGKTLTELAEDNYLKPIRDWARQHGTLFRSQTYGIPPVILSSNALVDLPEGEHGPLWRRFSAARWASSASHLYGKPVTSTETWTWLHSPAFRATPLDMKAEADRHFVQGINQLVGHGWPYSPPSAGEPGWSFYAAAAFNEHNPWFSVMPDVTRYLQRVCYLLRQGSPANDIAVYVPTDDAWAHLQLGNPTVDETVDARLGPVLIPAILNAGYNFDFIDDRAISAAGIPYIVLVLPNVERVPLATLQRLQRFVEAGGHLIATQSTPSLGTGLLEGKTETESIQTLSRELFAGKARFIPDIDDLAGALHEAWPPDLDAGSASSSIGFIHRKLAGVDIYFLANSSNQPVHAAASLRIGGRHPEWWDPFTGAITGAGSRTEGDRTELSIDLAPYESRVLVFSDSAAVSPRNAAAVPAEVDISTGWKVSFSGLNLALDYPKLHSWTDDERTRFYSGEAVYTKTVYVPNTFLTGASAVYLDFGPGTPAEPAPGEARHACSYREPRARVGDC